MGVNNLYSEYAERYDSFLQRNIACSMEMAITLDICEEYGGTACGYAAVFGSDLSNDHITIYVHAIKNGFTLAVDGVITRMLIPMERLEEIVTAFKQYGEKGIKEYITGYAF